MHPKNDKLTLLLSTVFILVSATFTSQISCQQLTPPDKLNNRIQTFYQRNNSMRERAVLRNQTQPKTLFIFIAIHPFNKLKYLPYVLGGLETQNYSKERIHILIHTEQLLLSKHCRDKTKTETLIDRVCNEQNLNIKTIKALKAWVSANENYYSNINLRIDLISEDSSQEQHYNNEYWSDSRFKRVTLLKQNALDMAKECWADFVLFMDADVILTNFTTFSYFLKDSHSVIAPLLSSIGTYSNFWAGISDEGYYKRTEDYLRYLYRETTGSFVVPMIHSCVFINLRLKDNHKHLTYLPEDDNKNHDDMLSLRNSAKSNGIDMYIDNSAIWGYLPRLNDGDSYPDDRIQDHDLMDLKLLALYESLERETATESSFPLAQSLHHMNEDEKHDLGVDHIYVINLPSKKERKKIIQESVKILGIEVEFFNDSVDGNVERYDMFRKYNITILPGYRDPVKNRTMTFGEIGCFLSHYKIWKDIVENDYADAIVFEDDVRFGYNFVNRWKDIIDNELHKQQYDFVFLSRKKLYALEDVFVSEHLVKPGYSYWLVGYMITAQGAKKLIDSDPLGKLLPSDEFLPIMYDKHPNSDYSKHFSKRSLSVLSIEPRLVEPQFFIGDLIYTSDTEHSEAVTEGTNRSNSSWLALTNEESLSGCKTCNNSSTRQEL